MLFIDDHPTAGFAIMHQKTHMDTYLVTTRARDPSKQRVAIEIALTELSLDLKDMRVKSASYGIMLTIQINQKPCMKKNLVSVYGFSLFRVFRPIEKFAVTWKHHR